MTDLNALLTQFCAYNVSNRLEGATSKKESVLQVSKRQVFSAPGNVSACYKPHGSLA